MKQTLYRIVTDNGLECEKYLKLQIFKPAPDVMIIQDKDLIVNTPSEEFLKYVRLKYIVMEIERPVTWEFLMTTNGWRMVNLPTWDGK